MFHNAFYLFLFKNLLFKIILIKAIRSFLRWLWLFWGCFYSFWGKLGGYIQGLRKPYWWYSKYHTQKISELEFHTRKLRALFFFNYR